MGDCGVSEGIIGGGMGMDGPSNLWGVSDWIARHPTMVGLALAVAAVLLIVLAVWLYKESKKAESMTIGSLCGTQVDPMAMAEARGLWMAAGIHAADTQCGSGLRQTINQEAQTSDAARYQANARLQHMMGLPPPQVAVPQQLGPRDAQAPTRPASAAAQVLADTHTQARAAPRAAPRAPITEEGLARHMQESGTTRVA